MHKLKQTPEDFIVEEINNTLLSDEGDFAVFLLNKTDITTEKAVSKIAEILNIKRSRINYAGAKDKNAVTSQYISIKDFKQHTVIKHLNFTLDFMGFTDEPISLGSHEGNHFMITVRNIDKSPKPKQFFPNFFGEQRFSKNNADIGKLIVKKQFKEAVELILTNQGDYEKDVKEYLNKNPTDYIGALRKIPTKILTLFIHSYQSLLWNQAVKDLIKDKPLEDFKSKTFPLIGFGTSGYDEILKKEGITARDFIIRQIPDLSSEGDERNIVAEIKDLKIDPLKKDELNQRKKKCILSFTLDKGCYATEAVKYLIQDTQPLP